MNEPMLAGPHTQSIFNGEPAVGCAELFCPSCGQLADQDHNAFWCNRCRRLWPKGVGTDQTEIKDGVWEMEGREKRESIIRHSAENQALTRERQ